MQCPTEGGLVIVAMYIIFIRRDKWISGRTKDALNDAFLRLVDIVIMVDISVIATKGIKKYNSGLNLEQNNPDILLIMCATRWSQ